MKLLAYNFNEALFIHDFVILDGTNEENEKIKDILDSEDTNFDVVELKEGDWFKVCFGDNVYLDKFISPDEIKSKMKEMLKSEWENPDIDMVELKSTDLSISVMSEIATDAEGIDEYKDDHKTLDDLVDYFYRETYEEQTVDGPTEMEIKILQFNSYEYKSAEKFLKIYNEGGFRRPEASDWE